MARFSLILLVCALFMLFIRLGWCDECTDDPKMIVPSDLACYVDPPAPQVIFSSYRDSKPVQKCTKCNLKITQPKSGVFVMCYQCNNVKKKDKTDFSNIFNGDKCPQSQAQTLPQPEPLSQPNPDEM